MPEVPQLPAHRALDHPAGGFRHVQRTTRHVSQPRLHIAGPDDLVAAVLQTLGSTPHESLVLVGINDTEVTGTVVVDLPAIALPGVLAALFRSIGRSHATDVTALVYSSTAANTALLAGPIAAAADWAGLDLLAALRVQQGTVRPLATPPHAVRPLATPARHTRKPAARRRTRR